MRKLYNFLTLVVISINFLALNSYAQDFALGVNLGQTEIQNPTFKVVKNGLWSDGLVERSTIEHKKLPPELLVGLLKYERTTFDGEQERKN